MLLPHNKEKGFTLIEILLSISLISILLFSVSGFLTLMFSSRAKSQTLMEVEENGIQIMQILTQTIRNADAITAPLAGASATTLTLALSDVLVNPTVFTFSNNRLRMNESVWTPNFLSSTHVRVTDLSFQNVSRTATPGIIRIQFTLTAINSGGRNEYDYSKTFYGTASLR